MNDLQTRLSTWEARETVAEQERRRLQFLNAPLPKDLNDPKLFEPVRVRAVRSFFVKGQAVEAGKTVQIERHLANSLASVGRVVILE
jgi:hypothetical protein